MARQLKARLFKAHSMGVRGLLTRQSVWFGVALLMGITVMAQTPLMAPLAPVYAASLPATQVADSAGAVALQAPVHTVVLPNGHHVYVIEKRNQPIVTIDTWVNTGSVNETAENNGVSHFLEHLLFKGTPTVKAGEADHLIESKGAVFNAATSNDFTHYYITLPSSFFNEALTLHADMLLNAVVPPDELAKERPVVQEEINRSKDNPQSQWYRQMMPQLFPGHGYGLDTLGPKTLIGTIPRQRILAYYQHWYQPKHFHTIIVGDVNTQTAVAAVKQAFATPNPQSPRVKTPFAYTPPTRIKTLPKAKGGNTVSGLASIDTLYWGMGWQSPAAHQLTDVAALDAAMYALGGGRNSRLFKQLVEENPLVSSVAAYNMTLRQAGAAVVYAEMKPEQWATVAPVIQQVCQQWHANGITQEELEAFKVQLLTEKRYEQETTHGLSSALGYYAILGDAADNERYLAQVAALTPKQVNAAIKRYVVLNQPTSMAIAPTAQVEAVKKDIAAWLPSLAQPTMVAAKNNGKKTAPQHEGAQPTPAVTLTQQTLPNGVTLILNPLPGAETTTLKLFAQGGNATQNKPGLADVAAAMLTKGTANRTAAELNAYLETHGVKLGSSCDDDTLSITASATADQWPVVQTLLLDVLHHPNFTQLELTKLKTRFKQQILANRDDLSARASETFFQALFPNHPYGAVGQLVLDSLDTITLTDITDYVGQTLRPQNLTVVISGKLPSQPTAMVQQLTQQLPYVAPTKGNKPNPAVNSATLAVQSAKTGQHTVALPNTSATRIIMGHQAPAITDPSYATAKVLAAILGNGMSSRLFTQLREKQGLAYEIYAAVQPGLQASTFMMVAGTDPKNQQAVETGFTQALQTLATQPVSAAELQAVKDKLTGQFALAHETPSSQGHYLGYYQTLGLGYGFDKTYPTLLQAVTPKQVQAMAQVWANQPATWAIVKPQ
jgi:zinc protease